MCKENGLQTFLNVMFVLGIIVAFIISIFIIIWGYMYFTDPKCIRCDRRQREMDEIFERRRVQDVADRRIRETEEGHHAVKTGMLTSRTLTSVLSAPGAELVISNY